jgi:hypothetical protein
MRYLRYVNNSEQARSFLDDVLGFKDLSQLED